jgi:hypothetical protein
VEQLGKLTIIRVEKLGGAIAISVDEQFFW